MKNQTKAIIGTVATVIAGLFGYTIVSQDSIEAPDMPSQTEMVELVGSEFELQGKVLICLYYIQAVEQRTYDQEIKIGNFPPQIITMTDTYWQTKKYKTFLPGKDPERELDLLKAVPPQSSEGKIIGIASIEKVGDKCKVYDF